MEAGITKQSSAKKVEGLDHEEKEFVFLVGKLPHSYHFDSSARRASSSIGFAAPCGDQKLGQHEGCGRLFDAAAELQQFAIEL